MRQIPIEMNERRLTTLQLASQVNETAVPSRHGMPAPAVNEHANNRLEKDLRPARCARWSRPLSPMR
jgi:hypothetical protein